MDQSNLTIMDEIDDSEDTFTLEPLQVVVAIAAVASVLANVLLIYVIIRYSVMRTRPNLYLANWCICNFIVLILAPLSLFRLFELVSFECECVWKEAFYGVLFGNLLFVIILLLDWYVGTYTKVSCSAACKQVHLFVIALVWIVIVSTSIASVTFCLLDWTYPLTLACFLFGYLVIFIVIITVYVMRCVKIRIFKVPVEKSKLELIVVTSYFICWLPNWVLSYGQMFLQVFFGDNFEYFTLFLGYSHAWIMLILLYFCDKSFRVYLRKTFGAKDRVADDTNVSKEQSTGLL